MQRFKDSEKKEWDVSFTVGLIERIKEHPDLRTDDDQPLDLGNSYQNEAIAKIDTDVVLLVRMMWVICEEQAEKHGITPEQFGERMVGDAIDQAQKAVVAALLDFFPGQKRALLAEIIAKQNMVMGEALNAMQRYFNNDQIKSKMKDALDRAMQEDAADTTSGAT